MKSSIRTFKKEKKIISSFLAVELYYSLPPVLVVFVWLFFVCLFSFSLLYIFLKEKKNIYILQENSRKFSGDSTLQKYFRDLIFFILLCTPKYTDCGFAWCLCPCKFTFRHVNLFNNSSNVSDWLFRLDFYFLQPLHTLTEVIPSAHTDRKSLPATRLARICFCSDLLIF